MFQRIAADIVVLVHFIFILFVVLGGVLVLRRPRIAWIHLPVAAWGALIEFTGWICPLTPLENRLRMAAGESGYTGSFIGEYLLPVVYPPGLTPRVQLLLGSGVLAINLVLYGILLARMRRSKSMRSRESNS